MKKSLKIILIFVIVIIIIGIITLLFTIINSNQPVDNQSYYTITYSASYNTYDVLNNSNDYDVVTEKSELDDILDKIQANNFQKINNNFFEDRKLLVIQAGINPEMHKLEINNKKVNATIYHASPMTTMDKIWTFSLYLIPIDKDIDNYNIEKLTYPNVTY